MALPRIIRQLMRQNQKNSSNDYMNGFGFHLILSSFKNLGLFEFYLRNPDGGLSFLALFILESDDYLCEVGYTL